MCSPERKSGGTVSKSIFRLGATGITIFSALASSLKAAAYLQLSTLNRSDVRISRCQRPGGPDQFLFSPQLAGQSRVSEALKSPARCHSRSTRSVRITASSRFLARNDRRRRRRSWRSHSRWRSNEAGSIIEPAMAESARRGWVSWHGKRLAPKKPPERWPIHGDESKRGNECGQKNRNARCELLSLRPCWICHFPGAPHDRAR